MYDLFKKKRDNETGVNAEIVMMVESGEDEYCTARHVLKLKNFNKFP